MKILSGLTLATIFFFLPQVVSAASFDCKKATTESEIAICDDFQLSVDDRIISYLYAKHLEWRKGRKGWFTGEGTETPVLVIREGQKKWLKNKRNTCGSSVPCLRTELDKRVDHFLQLVRLEKPQTGTNYSVYIYSVQNSKNALRIISGIVENIDKNGFLPKIEDKENAYFSKTQPQLYLNNTGLADYYEKRQPIMGHILAENKFQENQMVFGEFSKVDFQGLKTCLKGMRLSDFYWQGNRDYEVTFSFNKCITLSWPKTFSPSKPEEYIFFPMVKSSFILAGNAKILSKLRTCNKKSFEEICSNISISELNEVIFVLNRELLSSTYADAPGVLTYQLWLEDFILKESKGALGCDMLCLESFFSNHISRLTQLIHHENKVPEYCDFNESGVFECATKRVADGNNARSCIANNSAFQLASLKGDRYELNYWEDHYQLDETATESFIGSKGSVGTGICNYDVYSFDDGKFKMYNPACGSGFYQPVNTMFQIECVEGTSISVCKDNHAFCVSLECVGC